MNKFPLKKKFIANFLFFGIFFLLLVLLAYFKEADTTMRSIQWRLLDYFVIVLLFVTFVTTLEYLYTAYLLPYISKRFVQNKLAPILQSIGFKVSDGGDTLIAHIRKFPITVIPIEGDIQIAYQISVKCTRAQAEEFLIEASKIKRGLNQHIDEDQYQGYYIFETIISSPFLYRRAVSRMLSEIRKMTSIMKTLRIEPHG